MAKTREWGLGNQVPAIAAILNNLCHYHPASWIPIRLLDRTNNPPSSFATKMPSWGPPIKPPWRPNIPSFARHLRGIEQELRFWCLPICYVYGQVGEEGGSQEKTPAFLFRSETDNDVWCVGDLSLLPWAYVYLWVCVFVGMYICG